MSATNSLLPFNGMGPIQIQGCSGILDLEKIVRCEIGEGIRESEFKLAMEEKIASEEPCPLPNFADHPGIFSS